jgi:hypothetical protein
MPSSGEHGKPDTANEKYASKDQKHWLEYAIFVFVVLTAFGTVPAACYTRRQWLTADETMKRLIKTNVAIKTTVHECQNAAIMSSRGTSPSDE